MDCYLLVFDEESPDFDASFVEETFARAYGFSSKAWVIAPPEPTTCSDIVDALGIPKERTAHCIVAKLASYNGWAEKALWEKLQLWESL